MFLELAEYRVVCSPCDWTLWHFSTCWIVSTVQWWSYAFGWTLRSKNCSPSHRTLWHSFNLLNAKLSLVQVIKHPDPSWTCSGVIFRACEGLNWKVIQNVNNSFHLQGQQNSLYKTTLTRAGHQGPRNSSIAGQSWRRVGWNWSLTSGPPHKVISGLTKSLETLWKKC